MYQHRGEFIVSTFRRNAIAIALAAGFSSATSLAIAEVPQNAGKPDLPYFFGPLLRETGSLAGGS